MSERSAGAELLLRPFRLGDRESLTQLNTYGLEAAGIPVDEDHYAGEDIANLEGTYTPQVGGQLIVGEVRGVIVAMGGIRRVDESTCELLRMRVYPEYQGHGYGKRLLEQLERTASEMGYRRITLITGEDQHPAVDLYRQHSYQVERREILIGIPSLHMTNLGRAVSVAAVHDRI